MSNERNLNYALEQPGFIIKYQWLHYKYQKQQQLTIKEKCSMSAIVNVITRENLDSRGNPIIEANVFLESACFGWFSNNFYSAYRHEYPFDSGYNLRKKVYNYYDVFIRK